MSFDPINDVADGMYDAIRSLAAEVKDLNTQISTAQTTAAQLTALRDGKVKELANLRGNITKVLLGFDIP